jgi:hypothetical protein
VRTRGAFSRAALGSLALTTAVLVASGCGGGAAASGETTGGTNGASATSRGASSNNQGSRASAGGAAAALREGFMQGCTEGCVEEGLATVCDRYCACMFERMERDGFDRRAAQLHDPGVVATDPFFQDSLAACGPELVEQGFVEQCAEGDASLRPSCACVLARLCEGQSHEACALWILHNPSFGDRPEEAAQLQRAATSCMGGASN